MCIHKLSVVIVALLVGFSYLALEQPSLQRAPRIRKEPQGALGKLRVASERQKRSEPHPAQRGNGASDSAMQGPLAYARGSELTLKLSAPSELKLPQPNSNGRPDKVPTAPSKARVAEVMEGLPLSFEKNEGQVDRKARYFSRIGNQAVFFTRDGFTFPLEKKTETGHSLSHLMLQFAGANSNAEISGEEILPSKSNYLIGNNPAEWKRNVPQYAKVRYKQLYPGIDVVFYGNRQHLEYDVILAAGADPAAVRMEFSEDRAGERVSGRAGEGESTLRTTTGRERRPGLGTNAKLRIDESGDLIVHTSAGEIRQLKPKIYQEINGVKFPVPGKYALRDFTSNAQRTRRTTDDGQRTTDNSPFRIPQSAFDKIHNQNNPQSEIHNPQLRHLTPDTQHPIITFQIDDYDKSRPLLIDPQIVFTKEITTSSFMQPDSFAVDIAGNSYIGGQTDAPDLPKTNPLQPSLGGGTDAYIIKLSPQGTIVYATYLGGSKNDDANGIAVDASGNAYITGETASTNFPPQNPIQQFGGGSSDAFIAKLNPAGNGLVYSTFLGGSLTDRTAGIAVDSNGNAYVCGTTTSANFPSRGGFQPALKGSQNAFVAKLNASGSTLVYSSFLGGGSETASAVALDSAGNAYVTGSTRSASFPVLGAFQSTLRGPTDAFISKVNATGASLVYSTYLGGDDFDAASAIAVDASGSAYVAGETRSKNFPLLNPFQAALAGTGDSDAFVTKFSPSGLTLIYSSYLGGSKFDQASGIAVDFLGRAYVVGDTASTDFPTKAPIQAVYGGGAADPFLAQVGATGSLEFSTYLGDSSIDFANAIALTPPAPSPAGKAPWDGPRRQDFPFCGTPRNIPDIPNRCVSGEVLNGFEDPKKGTMIRLLLILLGIPVDFVTKLLNVTEPAAPLDVAVGDFNGDGVGDIAVASQGIQGGQVIPNLVVSTGIGDGTFGPPTVLPLPAAPRAISIMQSNMPSQSDGSPDADLDIIVATDAGIVEIFENQGNATGVFTADPSAPGNLTLSLPAGSKPVGVLNVDVNGDNLPDVITLNQGTGTVTTFLAEPSPKWGYKPTAPVESPVGANPVTLAVMNFNNDGKTDLVVANAAATPGGFGSVSVLTGDGKGAFKSAATFQNPAFPIINPTSVTVGRFNGTAASDDIVVVDSGTIGNPSQPGGVYLISAPDFVSQKEAAAAPIFRLIKTFPAGKNPASAAVGDFDGDGKPDLALANSGSNDVSVLLGDGKGGFAQAVNFPVGTNPVALKVGDLNRDGKDDIVVANKDSKNLTVLSNTTTIGEVKKSYFAQFGDGAGISSTITVVNPSASQAAYGSVTVLNSQGNPQPVDTIFGGKFFFGIPSLGVRSYATDGQGKLLVGSVQTASPAQLGGTILFSGSVGVAGVPAVSPLARFLVPIESDASRGVATGVALSNPTGAKLDVTLRLRNENGLPVANATVVVTLPANGQVAKFTEELLVGRGIDFSKFRGTLEITAPQAVNGMAIRVSPGQFATLPVTGTGSKRLLFAQFGEVAGVSSTLTFVNPAPDKTASVTVKIFDDSGAPLTVNLNGTDRPGQLSFSIPPQGVVSFSSPGSNPTAKIGSVVVDSTENIGGTILFGGSFGLAGVGASQQLSKFVAPIGQSSQGGVIVGLAMMNTGTTQATVKLTLRDESGAPVPGGALDVVLPPQGHVAKFIGQFFPTLSLADFRGTITGETSGQIGATVIRQSGVPLEFATLPVAEMVP